MNLQCPREGIAPQDHHHEDSCASPLHRHPPRPSGLFPFFSLALKRITHVEVFYCNAYIYKYQVNIPIRQNAGQVGEPPHWPIILGCILGCFIPFFPHDFVEYGNLTSKTLMLHLFIKLLQHASQQSHRGDAPETSGDLKQQHHRTPQSRISDFGTFAKHPKAPTNYFGHLALWIWLQESIIQISMYLSTFKLISNAT